MVPLFRGKPIQRKQPLYWRNHLAPADYRVALRDGDWKIIGSDDLTKFELYNLKMDWQESENLAGQFPDKFAQLKKRLIAHDQAVLADGPDWWKLDKPRKKRNRKNQRQQKKNTGPKTSR